MSLLDDFKGNTGIFNGVEGTIDSEAFNKLVEEHGVEVAKGYMKAIQEITLIIENVMVRPDQHEVLRRAPTSTVYNKIWNLHRALYDFADQQELEHDRERDPPYHSTRTLGW